MKEAGQFIDAANKQLQERKNAKKPKKPKARVLRFFKDSVTGLRITHSPYRPRSKWSYHSEKVLPSLTTNRGI